MKSFFKAWALTTAVVCTVVGFTGAVAETYSGTSWKINGTFGNSLGGATSSASYNLVDTGGESIIGEGSGGSYTLTAGYVSQLQNALQLTLQPSGLVGYWTFDEGSGNIAYDASGGGHNGSYSAGSAFYTGKVGPYAWSDTTMMQNIDIPYYSALPSGMFMSLGAWVYPTYMSMDVDRAHTIASQWNHGVLNGSWAFDQVATTASQSKLRVYIASAPGEYGNNYVETTSAPVTLNTWNHVSFVYDGTQAGQNNRVKIYYNGVEQATTVGGTIAGDLADSNSALVVADFPGLNRYYAGAVDDIKIYNRALSASEVAADYNSTTTGELALGAITPGISKTVATNINVRTDAAGYSLYINQDHDMTSGAYTIPALSSGTITTPAAWAEGTTKGLGFTMADTNATPIPIKWATGTKYAALPNVSTSFYTRTGIQSAVDYITLGLRADVGASQATGSAPYVNTVTITGTYTP